MKLHALVLSFGSLAAVGFSGSALAQEVEVPSGGGAGRASGGVTVTLVDGSIIRGELVEMIKGDHVTVRIATGEVRRIEWARVASVDADRATSDGGGARVRVVLTADYE